ncbi:hypothetical protein, partial [Salmonella enterica]|uniref:hypothetical protein n=1 Tax=Salmonella enterica TaxID=28901 RepID=UPI003C7E7D34
MTAEPDEDRKRTYEPNGSRKNNKVEDRNGADDTFVRSVIIVSTDESECSTAAANSTNENETSAAHRAVAEDDIDSNGPDMQAGDDTDRPS